MTLFCRFRRRHSKERRRRMELRRFQWRRVEGGGGLDASEHEDSSAQSVHRAVALLGLTLAREVLAMEETTVRRATKRLRRRIDVQSPRAGGAA